MRPAYARSGGLDTRPPVTITGMITCRLGEYTATSDGNGRVDIHGGHGELLDTLLVVVTTEAELVELLREWLRAS